VLQRLGVAGPALAPQHADTAIHGQHFLQRMWWGVWN
jgi:hypothetical protein